MPAGDRAHLVDSSASPCWDGIFRFARTVIKGDTTTERLAAQFMYFMSMTIMISLLNTCVDTLPVVRSSHQALVACGLVNLVTGAIFIFELVLRCMAAAVSPYALSEDGKTIPCRAVYRLVRDPLTWIDVLALAPLFFDVIDGDVEADAAPSVQALRLLRLLRLFTLARNFEGARTLFAALKRASPVLVVPLYFLVTAVLCFAGLLYVVEWLIGQNDEFNNMFSSSWFVLITMTTVGYGNIIPTTPLGICIDSLAMVVGALCMAMPITIMGSAFTDVWDERVIKKRSAGKANSGRLIAGDSHIAGRTPPGSGRTPPPSPTLTPSAPTSIKMRNLPRLRTKPAAGHLDDESVRSVCEAADVELRLRTLEQAVADVHAASSRTEAAMVRIEAALRAGRASPKVESPKGVSPSQQQPRPEHAEGPPRVVRVSIAPQHP